MKTEPSTAAGHPKDEDSSNPLPATGSYGNRHGVPVANSRFNAGSSRAFYEGLTGASAGRSTVLVSLTGFINEVVTVPQLLASIDRKQIDLKIDSFVSWETARLIFNRYISTFVPTCPMVVFPLGTTAEVARQTKPLLFLSILSVASAPYCPLSKQKELTDEVRRSLADCTVHQGEKSIELIQALQVSSLWYRAPDNYVQGNLFQLVQMATSLAMDLGLDNSRTLEESGRELGDWGMAEANRAWLGCFFLSAR